MVEAKRSESGINPQKEQIAFSRPVLVLVTGAGGTGKTSLARGLFIDGVKVAPGLAEFIPHVYIVSKDQIADSFILSRGADYEIAVRKKTYERVLDQTDLGMRVGANVIVDASHKSQIKTPGWETPYRQIAEENDAELKIIRLVSSAGTIRDRLIKRDSPVDAHKDFQTTEALDSWHREHEPIEVPMPDGTLIIDSSQDFNKIIRQALEFITANTKTTETIDLDTVIAQLRQLARPINERERDLILSTLRATSTEFDRDGRRAEGARQSWKKGNVYFHSLQDLVPFNEDELIRITSRMNGKLLELQACFVKDLDLYIAGFPPEEAEMKKLFETILEVGTSAHWYEDRDFARSLYQIYEELDKKLIRPWAGS